MPASSSGLRPAPGARASRPAARAEDGRGRPPVAAGAANDVAANLAAAGEAVGAAARAAGRAPAEITLIAVSKGHSASRIAPALAAGHTAFGENRVAEAADKWRALRAAWPDAALHLIGALQTNKVRDAVALADAIHAIDRARLATAVAREMERQGRRPACFIQVNTGAEPQKAGVLPEGLAALIALCRDELALPWSGSCAFRRSTRSRPCISRCCASSPPATASTASAWACPPITRRRSPSAPRMCGSARRFSGSARGGRRETRRAVSRRQGIGVSDMRAGPVKSMTRGGA